MAEKSPEKRLLEIIEGKNQQAARPSPIQAGRKYLSIDSLRSRFAFLKESFLLKRAKGKNIFHDLKTVNLMLKVIIAIAVAALFVTMGVEVKNLENAKLVLSDNEANAVVEPAAVASLLQPEDYYLKKAQARDIFQMGYKKRSKVDFAEDQKTPQVSQINELAKNLKLVGISWSDDPDAIIENSEIDKTYFVRKGYMIDALKVQDIQKDRVILRYKGEEVEIR